MAGNAHLESLESLKQLSIVLKKMRERTARELEATQIELHRLHSWLEESAPAYWEEQFKLAKRRWVDARQVLSDCESKVREDEQRSCTEPRKRMERASERLAFCERKLRILKQCRSEWEQEVDRVRPRIASLNELVETSFPLAIAKLQSHIDVLSLYSG